MSKVRDGVIEIPNLGVHTSYKRAKSHYNSVIEDRKKSTKGHVAHGPRIDDRVSVLQEDSFYLTGETVRLERWQIKK